MNLNVSTRNGRTYLYIEKGYREGGKVKKKNVRTIGYVDELGEKYDDPIAHFRAVAKKMTEEEKAKRRVAINVDMEEDLPEEATGAKNLGYALPLQIYHKLGLDKFLKGKARSEKFEFNTNSIMILLVVSRMLSPGSKLKAYNERGRYFERFDFSYDDVGRSLPHFDKLSGELQRFLHESVRTEYGADLSTIYYDVTNYYFEINKQDGFRKYSGNAKQKRKKPVVQMGLAMDNHGIPIHYELFPGNKLDKETFRSVIGNIRKNYDTGRIVVVADMGVITGDNINYLVGGKPSKPMNGYIFSFSVRGGADAFQKYVLSADGYAGKDGKHITEKTDFLVKDRVIAREINVTMDSGRTVKKTVYEKQVVFWSKKYFVKARMERNEILVKAMALIEDPKKYSKATSYGAAAYVDNLEYDKKTGEILETGKQLSLNLPKIREQEKYDGYYSIVTSELNMPTPRIIEKYRGLWEIEETFKITKSDLEGRPIYARRKDSINAHFLTCFIALVILRIIHKTLNREFSPRQIVECLNKIECINEQENIYLFGYRSKTAIALGKAFGIDFAKRRLYLSDIKKILGDVKK
jgi:transposase